MHHRPAWESTTTCAGRFSIFWNNNNDNNNNNNNNTTRGYQLTIFGKPISRYQETPCADEFASRPFGIEDHTVLGG